MVFKIERLERKPIIVTSVPVLNRISNAGTNGIVISISNTKTPNKLLKIIPKITPTDDPIIPRTKYSVKVILPICFALATSVLNKTVSFKRCYLLFLTVPIKTKKPVIKAIRERNSITSLILSITSLTVLMILFRSTMETFGYLLRLLF